MRGKKHKIRIEEIKNKSTKAVTFTKRKDGLFRKASELCRVSPDTRIAVLVPPMSENSHVSFFSFGHSSVDHVVSSLLSGQPPPPLPKNNVENRPGGSGHWWEDKRFDTSEDVDELNEALDAISRMLNNVRLRLDDAVESNQNDKRLVIHQDQSMLEEVHQPFSEEKTTTNEDTDEFLI